MPKIGNQKYSKSLYLGRQFENNARTVRFDISEWVNEFGAGTVELLHMRHGDTVPYSVPFSRVDADGNKNDLIGTYVLWNVTSIDTAQAFSDGQAELRYYAENADDYLLKSETYRTVVSEALGTPLPEEDWYKSLVSKVSSMDDILGEVTAIRDEILSGGTGGVITENNYTTAEKNKLASIEDGAEVNVIVSVSVNNTHVDIVNKNVALSIPTKVSELTNDSGYLTEHQDISSKLDVDKVGVSGGVAELDENGIIISSQLPSFVDDVLECMSVVDFPPNGESGKIYVATDTNLSYRWSGSAYVEISPSIAIGETSSTAYRGDRGKTAYNHSQTTGNAHAMTKADIELGNVPNVATNDQTPTYTAASTLAALNSGEKLSVAFGKLAKGISDLISHLADSIKHITAAERTAWNNKVDKVTGKDLSANDYTTAEKNKLANIAAEANKTIIDTTLSNAGQAADAKTTGDKFSELQNLINRMEIHCTASGNPATFSDADAADIKDLRVTITPAQSGSGTPSPSNIRPISGVSSVTVTRTDANGANSKSVTVTLSDGSNPLTVYGGTFDVTTGTLTVDRAFVVLNSAYYTGIDHRVLGSNLFAYALRSRGIASNIISPNLMCSHYHVISAYSAWGGVLNGQCQIADNYFGFRDSQFSTIAEVDAFLDAQNSAETPVTICYKIAPVTYQLTGQNLATLSGYNAVSSDAGSVDVTYRANVSFA